MKKIERSGKKQSKKIPKNRENPVKIKVGKSRKMVGKFFKKLRKKWQKNGKKVSKKIGKKSKEEAKNG